MEDISIVDVKPQTVLGMRRRGPYKEIANMIPKLYEYVFGNNIQPGGPPLFVCHEMSMEQVMKADKENDADVEVAVPIMTEVKGTDNIRCYELSGGKMVKTIHKGPYEDCGPTYEKLFAWINEKGLKITGFTREVYLNDPREISPEEILTEIYAPIE